MKIICRYNRGLDLPEDCLYPSGGYIRDAEFHLEINKMYTVYALTIERGYIWYYICDESYTYYPIWKPSPLFDVIDGNISKYWIYNFSRGDNLYETDVTFAFPEWTEDPYDYYDKLSDGEEKEVNIFNKYKALMDLEFPDDSIKEKAVAGNGCNLMCPLCFETWESDSVLGMIECPKCKSKLHNPRYKKLGF